jgi:hypothetical protein
MQDAFIYKNKRKKFNQIFSPVWSLSFFIQTRVLISSLDTVALISGDHR